MPATDPILSVLRQNNNPDIPTLTISNVSYPSLLTIRREFDKFHTLSIIQLPFSLFSTIEDVFPSFKS